MNIENTSQELIKLTLNIDTRILSILTPRAIKMLSAMPVYKNDRDEIVIIMVNPDDLITLDNLSTLLKKKFVVKQVSGQLFQDLYVKYFTHYDTTGKYITYITSPANNEIVALRLKDREEIARIKVPNNPTEIRFIAGQNKLYVVTSNSGEIAVIDRKQNKVVKTIEIGNGIGDITNPLLNRCYTTSINPFKISIINTEADEVGLTFTPSSSPSGIAITLDGKKMYVTSKNNNSVLAINAEALKAFRQIAVGKMPTHVCISADGILVFVLNQADNTVSVINALDDSVITTIPVGTDPYSALYSNIQKKLYVINRESSNISIISVDSLKVVDTIPIGGKPKRAVMTPDERYIMLTNEEFNDITIIDIYANLIVANIPACKDPFDIALVPEEASSIRSTMTVKPKTI